MIAECMAETSDALMAICWQARATLEAAEITAKASSLQGWLTLLAGGLAAGGAVYGGWMAYLGGIRQSKLAEDAQNARIAAYRFKLNEIVAKCQLAAGFHLIAAEEQVAQWSRSAEPQAISLKAQQYTIPRELRADDWEEHAKLGLDIVGAVHRVTEAIEEAYRFGDEMLRGPSASDTSRLPTVKKTVENPDGSMTVEFDCCVEQNVKTARDLVDALRRLRELLD